MRNYYSAVMAHKSADELRQMLEEAKSKVKVTGKYFHYKHPDQFYTIVDIIVIEETDLPGVLYRAEYEPLVGIIFLRPIADFLAEVEVDGEMKPRFTLVE